MALRHRFHDLSYAEIAGVCACPVGTVRSRIYTVAVVRRMLGAPPAASPRPGRSEDWVLLLIAAATVAVAAGVALQLGLSPWWLLALPLAAIPIFPILLRKGA